MSCKEVIVNWIMSSGFVYTNQSKGKTIYNHIIETDLKLYADHFLNKKHNSETWTREFRKFRSDANLHKKLDIEIVETQKKKVKGWKVIRNFS